MIVFSIIATWDESGASTQVEPDPHLFWIKDGQLRRKRNDGASPIRISPETELGISQPFSHAPRRFVARFKETELVGESTYRDAPTVQRVKLEDAQALISWLSRLREIENFYGGSDGCYFKQMEFLRGESKRADLPFTIDLN